MKKHISRPLDGLFGLAGSLILILVLSLEAGATENLPSYYPQSMRNAIQENADSKQLRKVIFSVLSMAHITRENAPDELLESCHKTASCYKHEALSYTRARTLLFGRLHLLTDRNNNHAVTDVYCDRTFTSEDFPKGQGPAPDRIPSHQILNTEHTWPQSKFSRSFPKDLQKGDLHILYPVGTSVNSSRSNLPFGEVSAITQSHCPKAKRGLSPRSNRSVFEPSDEHKGNVARAMFYFSVRYNLPIDDEQEETLRAWDKMDPVDDEERERNEQIFELQGNRNPFIDYPSLSSLIKDF